MECHRHRHPWTLGQMRHSIEGQYARHYRLDWPVLNKAQRKMCAFTPTSKNNHVNTLQIRAQ
eukprot:391427-Amphidinium_carterae.1